MTKPLSDRDYESLAAFRRELRRFLAFSEEAARSAGLTPAHHQLLLAIRGHAGGAPSISDVADALRVERDVRDVRPGDTDGARQFGLRHRVTLLALLIQRGEDKIFVPVRLG